MSRVRIAPFLPGLALLVAWIVWLPLDGGYFARTWYPSAIFLVALLAAVALGGAQWRPPAGAGRVPLALLAAFTGWSFASMLWSQSPGSGWEGSNQLVLYLAMAWLAALVPWRTDRAAALGGVWSLAVAVVCGVELASALGATHLERWIFESRWQQPTGYANAAAAIAAMGCWPALALAARRGIPAAIQVAALAVAGFLVEFSQLPQSRGSVIGMLVALPVFIAFAPARGRLLVRIVVVALTLALTGGPIWDLYGAGEAHRSLHGALDSAARAVLIGTLVVAAAGAVLALIERQVELGPGLTRAARRLSAAALVALALAVGGLGVAHAGQAADYASARWSDFSSNSQVAPDTNPTRLAQRTSDKRYDYWRVAVAAFRAAPVGGLGAGGFEHEYTKERRYPKPSRSPHSVWVRALAETGVIGVILIVALVAALAAGLVRAYRRLDTAARWVVAAAAGTGAYFAGHATVDWLELFPALAGPAIVLPFVAMRLGTADPRPAARWWRLPWPAVVAGVVVPVVAIASLALPYLSLRYVETALRSWRGHPEGAARELRWAAALDPLSADARVAQGRIALAEGRFEDARLRFEQALGREDDWYPHFVLSLLASRAGRFAQALDREEGWYPHFEIALIDSRDGRFASAAREIARARALNPPDPLVIRAAALIRARKRIDPRRVERERLLLPLYRDARHL